MPNLASTDILIVLIYFFFMLAVGISLKPLLAGGLDFLQAGRALPAWICGLAMTMASLGSQELIGMGLGRPLRIREHPVLSSRRLARDALCRILPRTGLLQLKGTHTA